MAITCEIWLAIDSDGDWVVARDRDDVLVTYRKLFAQITPLQIVKVVLENVPVPEVLTITANISQSQPKSIEVLVREVHVE